MIVHKTTLRLGSFCGFQFCWRSDFVTRRELDEKCFSNAKSGSTFICKDSSLGLFEFLLSIQVKLVFDYYFYSYCH